MLTPFLFFASYSSLVGQTLGRAFETCQIKLRFNLRYGAFGIMVFVISKHSPVQEIIYSLQLGNFFLPPSRDVAGLVVARQRWSSNELRISEPAAGEGPEDAAGACCYDGLVRIRLRRWRSCEQLRKWEWRSLQLLSAKQPQQ